MRGVNTMLSFSLGTSLTAPPSSLLACEVRLVLSVVRNWETSLPHVCSHQQPLFLLRGGGRERQKKFLGWWNVKGVRSYFGNLKRLSYSSYLTVCDTPQLPHDLLGQLCHQIPGYHPPIILQPCLMADPLPHLVTKYYTDIFDEMDHGLCTGRILHLSPVI